MQSVHRLRLVDYMIVLHVSCLCHVSYNALQFNTYVHVGVRELITNFINSANEVLYNNGISKHLHYL